jgi:hypothetical protein
MGESHKPAASESWYWFRVPDEKALFTLDPAVLKIFLVIARAIQQDENGGFLSVRHIAERAHTKGLRAVSAATRLLCQAGWFTRHDPRTGVELKKWQGRTVEYRFKRPYMTAPPHNREKGQNHVKNQVDKGNCFPEGNSLRQNPDCFPQGYGTVSLRDTELFPSGIQHLEPLEASEVKPAPSVGRSVSNVGKAATAATTDRPTECVIDSEENPYRTKIREWMVLHLHPRTGFPLEDAKLDRVVATIHNDEQLAVFQERALNQKDPMGWRVYPAIAERLAGVTMSQEYSTDDQFMAFMGEVALTGSPLIEADYEEAYAVWLRLDFPDRFKAFQNFSAKRAAGMFDDPKMVMRPAKWLKRCEFNRAIPKRKAPGAESTLTPKGQRVADNLRRMYGK